MNPMNPEVAVIILNWNGWEDTVECLESLYQINYPRYHVVLVDNHSTDDSLEKITSYCEGHIKPESKFYRFSSDNKPVKIFRYSRNDTEDLSNKIPEAYSELHSNRRMILVENDENSGFSEGNNIGMRYALKNLKPNYIMLLNNDTVVDPDFLYHLVKTGQSDEKIAVIGPKIYFYDFDGSDDVVWSVGGVVDLSRYPGYHDIQYKKTTDSTMDVGWISGAAMLIKADLIPKNLLNSEFFFGCEDVDLCIGMGEKGYSMVTNLKSKVWHKSGASKTKVKFRGISREIKTNLKFMKAHEKNYNLHLPIYTVQLLYRYSSMLIKKIARDIKNS